MEDIKQEKKSTDVKSGNAAVKAAEPAEKKELRVQKPEKQKKNTTEPIPCPEPPKPVKEMDADEKKAYKKALKKWKKDEKRRREEAKSFAQNVFETIAYAAVVALIALVVKKWVGQPVIIDGNSMNDTLSDMNFVWSNKIAYTPERFDVVIVKSEKTQNKMYIKRIVGMPGETIYVDADDKIHITPADGGESFVLDDVYGYFAGNKMSSNIRMTNFTNENMNPDGSFTIPEGQYFVMGDNRYNSQDSRVLGSFTRDEIDGHAVARIWPLNKLGDFDKSNEK